MCARSRFIIATRGSSLALAQAESIRASCRAHFPELAFEIRTFRTTGDRLQTEQRASGQDSNLKALFTKEIEEALLGHEADLAVHSMKDLPAEMPEGLQIAAVPSRADARDVLAVRTDEHERSEGGAFAAKLGLDLLPHGATVATGSVRRRAQLRMRRPDLGIVPIRGNVGTRLRKLHENREIDATLLGAAGLERLACRIDEEGRLSGPQIPEGLGAIRLPSDVLIPCVGQGALAVQAREGDTGVTAICARFDDYAAHQCALAERAFLKAVGGDCQSPMAAYAQVRDHTITLSAGLFHEGHPQKVRREKGSLDDPKGLGRRLADALLQ